MVDGGECSRWLLRLNCSLTPRQVLLSYFPVCVLLAAIGTAGWWLGAHWVLPFAALEIVVFAGALLAYARHAGDREVIEFRSGHLVVRHCHAQQVSEVEFRSSRVRVEQHDGGSSLIEVSEPGRRAFVGRYMRPEKRARLADELRRALNGPS